MADQHLLQPQALVGNPVSDAYFGALRRSAGSSAPKCAHCGADLSKVSRLSDGQDSWCDESHRTLWARARQEANQRRELTRRGWTAERWAARR